ncbi:unnamed protein product [Chrysoparadoxa australica]
MRYLLSFLFVALYLALESEAFVQLAPSPLHCPSTIRAAKKGGSGGKGKKARGGREKLEELVPQDDIELEWSRPFQLHSLVRGRPRDMNIQAEEEECNALASRFGLSKIESLQAKVSLERADSQSGNVIVAQGRVTANVVQLCVATLRPFPVFVDAPFRSMIREADAVDEDDLIEFGMGIPIDDDDAETLDIDEEVAAGGVIDLGEMAAQYLVLSIDRYAKHPEEKE